MTSKFKNHILSYILYYGHQNISQISSIISMASQYFPCQKKITQLSNCNKYVESIIM